MFAGLQLAKQLLKAVKKQKPYNFTLSVKCRFVCKQKLVNYHEHIEHFYKPSRFRKLLLVTNVQCISIIIYFASDAIFSCFSLYDRQSIFLLVVFLVYWPLQMLFPVKLFRAKSFTHLYPIASNPHGLFVVIVKLFNGFANYGFQLYQYSFKISTMHTNNVLFLFRYAYYGVICIFE